MSSRSGSVVALILTGLGFSYLVYLFVLACFTLLRGIPGEREWEVIREAGTRPEIQVFAFSSLWGLVPLALLAVSAFVALRRAGQHEDAYRYRWLRRVTVALLLIGLPLAMVAYVTWYRIGW